MSTMKLSSVMFAMLLGAGTAVAAVQSPSPDVPADPAQPPITGAPVATDETTADAATATAATEADPAMILGQFQQLDADKSGSLSSTEAANDVDLKDVFKQFDTDANMLLTLAEFRAFAVGKQAAAEPNTPEDSQ